MIGFIIGILVGACIITAIGAGVLFLVLGVIWLLDRRTGKKRIYMVRRES